jgi:hypothetical protein
MMRKGRETMGNNHKHLQEECIRVQKVYDWVTDTLSCRKTVTFTPEQIAAIDAALEDPALRPLRIIAKVPKTTQSSDAEACPENFLCEQVGDKRDCTVAVNGGFTEAQLVELMFTTEVRILVVDRNGDIVTETTVDASCFEPFVLCYPDGTDLFCRITKIFARIPSGTILLNPPAPTSILVDITFCIDVQVEAEVKLEVLAKFCSPRENDLVCEEGSEGDIMCPAASFPQQCPDIYPRRGCLCKACGESSGLTDEEKGATVAGRATIFVDICPDCQLANSSFQLNFIDTETSEGLRSFNFTATEFTQDTLCCEEHHGGLKLTISGRGNASTTDEVFHFNLALVQKRNGNLFEVEILNAAGEKEFSTGTVTADEGRIVVENCLQHH